MYILGIDTSSIVATTALITEEKLLCEYIVNNEKNHSEKLMGVIDQVVVDSGIDINMVDAIAVAKGPGSFTGIRIGMACAQGIAHALKKPVIGVNTLDGLANNLMYSTSLLCPVVDAQRGDVYSSLFKWENGIMVRLWDYKMIRAEELVNTLLGLDEQIIIMGDGSYLIKEHIRNSAKSNITISHSAFLMPRASSIAEVGLREFQTGRFDSCFSIKPFYIRKSNAEEKWEEGHGSKGIR
ncbi:MAG: tRNA (adenosine(37)-N6)-threonylcarbamoyltransferase complex dimerization subunit type 1 TsaB [Tepidanaerobacteraceae bacterium]